MSRLMSQALRMVERLTKYIPKKISKVATAFPHPKSPTDIITDTIAAKTGCR